MRVIIANEDGEIEARRAAPLPAGPPEDVLGKIGRTVDDLVLEMRDHDAAIVVAPAGALTDAVNFAEALARTDVLRSGRVRAMVKLPTGLVTSAPREALALWVLGRETGDVPIGDRFTAVAALTDPSPSSLKTSWEAPSCPLVSPTASS